jgi:hypothetical protein
LGDSAGFELQEAPAGLELRAIRAEEEEAPLTLGEFCVPPRLGGFEDPGTDFSVLGIGGLSAFRDFPLVGTIFVEESGLISWGTLHRGSQVTN